MVYSGSPVSLLVRRILRSHSYLQGPFTRSTTVPTSVMAVTCTLVVFDSEHVRIHRPEYHNPVPLDPLRRSTGHRNVKGGIFDPQASGISITAVTEV
jgi:hypothetical protein